jgi:uncharacterized membrane protein YbhN (UPF0104 family)
MKTATTIIILRLFGGISWSLAIVGSIASVYFLYQVLAHDAPWVFPIWLVVVAFAANQASSSIYDTKRQLEYVEQLLERGYLRADAEAAWRIAKNGGMNLLTNLHQVELSDEIDRLESALGNPSSENTGC